MSEKKYLLTAREIFDIVNDAACAGSALESIDDIPSDEWLKAHEYRERTCHVIPDGCIGRCSACGADVFGDPYGNEGTYCPNCGARVVGAL